MPNYKTSRRGQKTKDKRQKTNDQHNTVVTLLQKYII